MSDFVLEIRNLTRRFGKFTAVDSLTLSVNAGEVFGLLGSNGAGKTTTIKMLTTLLPPSSGDAHVAGFSITTQAVGVRRAIGYVPQAVSMDGSLTGYENLLIFAKLYDLPHREPCGSRRRSRGSAHTLRRFPQIGGEPGCVDPLALIVLEVLQMISVPVLLRERQYDHGLADEDGRKLGLISGSIFRPLQRLRRHVYHQLLIYGQLSL